MFNLQPLLANVGNGHTAPGLSNYDTAMTHDSNRTERTPRVCDDEATSSEQLEPPRSTGRQTDQTGIISRVNCAAQRDVIDG
jgi:hypothetical protein